MSLIDPIDPSRLRYILLRSARRALQGLSDGCPPWAQSAARDAALNLERAEDFRLPFAVSAVRLALLGACADIPQRSLVVAGGTLMADAALKAEAELVEETKCAWWNQ